MRERGAFLLMVCFFLIGCATTKTDSFSRFYGWDQPPVPVEELVKENAPTADQPVRIEELARTANASYHIVQIRDREQPHTHQAHEAVARLEAGEGIFVLGRQVLSLKAGDIVVIPQGKPHFFVNTGKEPAVAWVMFIPPFDGKDYVPLLPQSAQQDPEKQFVLEEAKKY